MKLYLVLAVFFFEAAFAFLSDIPDDIREDARLTTVYSLTHR